MTLIVIHITDEQPHRPLHSALPAGKTQAAPSLLGRAGRVVQLVKLEDRAWHGQRAEQRLYGHRACRADTWRARPR